MQLYSFAVSAVYKFNEGRILTDVDVSISGFYSHVESPELRYIIHTGVAEAAQLNPHLLWTANCFNYRVYDNKSIVLTLPKQFGKFPYSYYLVKFADPLELTFWKTHYGKHLTETIHEAPGMITNYFQKVYDRNV